jgi:hypothetical protein
MIAFIFRDNLIDFDDFNNFEYMNSKERTDFGYNNRVCIINQYDFSEIHFDNSLFFGVFNNLSYTINSFADHSKNNRIKSFRLSMLKDVVSNIENFWLEVNFNYKYKKARENYEKKIKDLYFYKK